MCSIIYSKLGGVFAVIALLVGVFGSAVAAAPATPTPDVNSDILAFAIYPADKQFGDYFSPTIDTGSTATLQVILANTGKVEFEARTLAVNASTGPNGGFQAASSTTKPEGVTTWLDYPETTYSLKPGKGIQIPLTIAVPSQTAPSQYVTAIAMETAEAKAIGGSTAFKQIIRQVVPVFITVPGPVNPKFDIGNINLTKSDKGALITLEIENSGNVLVKPKGSVAVTDAKGATVLSAPINMGSVYARDKTTLSVSLPALASGTYAVSVNLKDDATGATAAISNVKVTFSSDATPVAPPPISITTATAVPQPSLKKIQFLGIDATITNNGSPVSNARLTLHVSRDDQVVEDYSLNSSLALPAGDTTVQSRYIPATGWKSGTWAFTLTLETVDPATGADVVVGTTDLGGPVVIP